MRNVSNLWDWDNPSIFTKSWCMKKIWGCIILHKCIWKIVRGYCNRFVGCLTFHLHCITEKLKKFVWSCYLDIESSNRVHMDLRKQKGHDATKLNIFIARLWRTRKKKRQGEESFLPLDQIDWWKWWSGIPFHGALSKPFLKEFLAGMTEHLSRSSSSPEFLVVFETRAVVLHEWIWLVQRFFQSSYAIWRSRKDHSNLQD